MNRWTKRRLRQLEQRCTAEEYTFPGEQQEDVPGLLLYLDRGSDILGIAHLDTIQQGTAFEVVRDKGKAWAVMSGRLDDRLGAFLILDLLPELGIQCDVLLTTGEEIGMSTAEFFTPPEGKEYNWLFSFDREGLDAVFYQYEDCTELVADVGEHFPIGYGSFSDLSFMHLEAAGFNVGTGLIDGHWPDAWVPLEHLDLQLDRFLEFCQEHKGKRYEWDPAAHPGYFRDRFRAYESVYQDQADWQDCKDCKGAPLALCKQDCTAYGMCGGCWKVKGQHTSRDNDRHLDGCPYCGGILVYWLSGKCTCLDCGTTIGNTDRDPDFQEEDWWTWCPFCMDHSVHRTFPDLLDVPSKEPRICWMCGVEWPDVASQYEDILVETDWYVLEAG